jgi:hypothetical protein
VQGLHLDCIDEPLFGNYAGNARSGRGGRVRVQTRFAQQSAAGILTVNICNGG